MATDKDVERFAATEVPEEVISAKLQEDEKIDREQQHPGALERYINGVTTMNFSFVLLCSWTGAAASLQLSLLNGGPASIVYGCIFAGIGTTLVAISLAEMASMYGTKVFTYAYRHLTGTRRDPTVGAQYRWSATFAPRWNRFFGLMQGWITVFGWICSTASTTALVASVITGLAIFNYPEYVPQRWHFTLLMWAATIVPFLINLRFKKVVTFLEAFGAVCHVGIFTASIITLGILAERSTVGYVFHTLTNDISGWKNPVVAWGIGLLTVAFPLTGFDSVIHMSDEVKKARVQVPRSMITSVVSNAIMQFLYMITVLFAIGDVDVVLADPLPIIQVYYQATGSKPATNFFVSMFAILGSVAFFNCFASTSRLVWAFARDNGLPFSATFACIHPRLKLPINALLVVAACVCLLSLINIGSSTAFNAIISLVALAIYISYFFPILFLLWRRLSTVHPTPIPWGPFRLGRTGPLINFVALCYISFMLIWMPFPAFLPVDAVNMNYAGPITGGVILCALVDWCVSGRKRFRVPVTRPNDLD